MMMHEALYIIFFSMYPLGVCISYGFNIELLIFFLHIFYPLFVNLPMFLHLYNILCILFLTNEIYFRYFFFQINAISSLLLYDQCIICFESKFRILQFECCPFVKVCGSCFRQLEKCPICKKNLLLLVHVNQSISLR